MTTYTLISADFTRFCTRQRDVLKVAAFAAMVLDHINTASELNATLLQAVGRLAFPLFALVWGYNVVRRPVTQACLATFNVLFRDVMTLSGLLLSLITLIVVCRHVPQGNRLPGGRWFAQLYVLHLIFITARLYLS